MIITEIFNWIITFYCSISIAIALLHFVDEDGIMVAYININEQQIKWNSLFAITVTIFRILIKHI